jgi:hypothetical protein
MVKLKFAVISPAKIAEIVPNILAVICPDKIAAILAEMFQLRLRKIEIFLSGNMPSNASVNQPGIFAKFFCGKMCG